MKKAEVEYSSPNDGHRFWNSRQKGGRDFEHQANWPGLPLLAPFAPVQIFWWRLFVFNAKTQFGKLHGGWR
jgi:hypothetical protein